MMMVKMAVKVVMKTSTKMMMAQSQVRRSSLSHRRFHRWRTHMMIQYR
jgi:hypothetical protein